ncbi:MAG TPA: S8 family peptidase [Pyrinomonadaceae bacterium]|nr:S8 family peptidase [Pyrinomonadaceae bacterium]
MKRFIASLGVAALVLAAALAFSNNPSLVSSGQGKSAVHKKQRPVPGQYIVVLKEWAAQPFGENSFAGRIAEDVAAQHGGQVLAVYKHALLGFSIRLNERAAEALAHDPRVESVEEDGVVTASATQTNPPWGLDRIDQRDRPLNGQYNYTPTGAGVHAYIIDTGIRASHTQFTGRVGNGATAISDGNGTNDCNGHGTHVAGTVGGTTYGVAKGVTLHPVRVLDCAGNGTDSGVIAGVDWVRANRVLPAVANMSLGGGASSALDTAVNNAINAGITFVAAAGNDYGANACNYSPARVANAITVGSTTSTDTRSDFSNIGTCLDIFAPGSSIQSAWYTSDTAAATIDGTSMASPHVAGVAALYLQNNTSASPATVANAIITTATTNRLTGIGTGSPNRLLYSLLTTGGNDGGGGVPTTCSGGTLYTGTLSGTGASQYQPGGSYYYSSVSGSHRGCLVGPSSGADFDLYLQRWNGSSWVTVARGETATSNETVSYSGTAAYYRWQVYSYSGSGSYNLWIVRP